ncbi:MAG: TolC family protein [Bradymonadales bacterium]|nr:TolC family protein [Bradymonadales bacterium]
MRTYSAFLPLLVALTMSLATTPAGAQQQTPFDQSPPPQERGLSLAEALDLAFRQNLSLESGRATVRSLSNLSALVRSQWLPRVVAYGVYIHNDHATVMDLSASMGPLMEMFLGLNPLMEALGLEPIQVPTDSEPMVVQHQEDYRAGGSISVEFSPQSLIQYDSANLAQQQGEESIEQARLQIGMAITDLYYGLVTQKAVREVAERNVQMRQMSLEHARARFEAGTVNELDVLRAQMALDEALAQVTQLDRSFVILRNQVATLLQTPPDFTVSMPAIPPFQETPDQVWQQAEQRHPQLLAAATAWEIAQNAVTEVSWSWAPTLSAAFNVSAARTTAMNDETVRWDLTFQASWPLFLGGARFVQRSQRTAEEEAAYLQYLEFRSSLQTQIETAFLEREQLQEDLLLARRQLETARVALGMAQAMYDEGLGTQLDLLQAETMVFAIEIEVTTKEIALHRQNAHINSLTGAIWIP